MPFRRAGGRWTCRRAAATVVFTAAAFESIAVIAGAGEHRESRASGAAAARVKPPVVVLLVDNLARLSERELTAAQDLATTVLRSARLESIWIDCRADPPEPAALQVWVVLSAVDRSERMIARLEGPADLLGMSLPRTRRAYIFSERIRRFAAHKRRSFEHVLGHVLAHEIGHHLLPGEGHTDTGIMQGDIGHAFETPWFTRRQTGTIRAMLPGADAATDVPRAAMHSGVPGGIHP